MSRFKAVFLKGPRVARTCASYFAEALEFGIIVNRLERMSERSGERRIAPTDKMGQAREKMRGAIEEFRNEWNRKSL